MKKLFAILLALAMVLSLAACGGGGGEETTAPKDETTAPPAVTDPVPEGMSYTFTQYGNAKITILGAEFTKTDYDEDVLRIYYDYTNTSDTACRQCPSYALMFESVTQDGNDLGGPTYFSASSANAVPEDLQYDCLVQPGLTSRQTMLFKCDPNGGVVDISCYIMIGSWVYDPAATECFTFQIDPKDLPEVPEPLEMAPILEPTYAAGLPTSGVNDGSDDSEISIDGWELTKGEDGEDVLRVMLTVTNNGEDAMMPMNITGGVEAYQDGLGLMWFSTWHLEATEADEAYEEDLEPGETVKCNALFQLRNNHPVEIVIEDLNVQMRLGTICDIEAAFQAQKDAEQAANDAAAKAEAEARKQIVGCWLQRDSDWEDTYIFNEDGTGKLVSGPEYTFTYEIDGDILRLDYGDEDVEDFTFSVSGDVLTLIDMWGDELLLDRQAYNPNEETEPEPETEPTEEPETEPTVSMVDQLIGTWVCADDGETYSFSEDGTGYQIYEGVTYTYTYETSDDYIWISYDDGDSDSFYFYIEGDTLTIAGNWTYTRQ